MTRNKVERSLDIEKFAEEIWPTLLASATVSDNWLNQVKVYLKSELTDIAILHIFLITFTMYMELLNARIADLLSREERQILIYKCISGFVDFESLLVKKGRETHTAQTLLKLLSDRLHDSQAVRRAQDLSIAQYYSQYFMASESIGGKLSEDVLSQYVASQIQTFEDQNYRNKLVKILELR